MTDSPMIRNASLRSVILSKTGQDVGKCCSCMLCETITDDTDDVSLAMLMQWVLASDERALTNRTVWSDRVLQQADHACASQLDMPAVLLALRDEARQRGLAKDKP